jgi:outer membrane lipoprotein-sorting protein
MMRLLLIMASLLASAHAVADPAGDDWLRRIDAASTVSDAHLRLELQVTDARGTTAQREIEIWQKGTAKRLVRLVSPARLSGIGLLVSGEDSLHLFLPSYPPARRVVGSKRADAFMGTDFAMEDLSTMEYSSDFSATVDGSSDTQTRLRLIPTLESSDSSVILWVASTGVPVVHRVEHLGPDGSVTRRLTMTDFRVVGGLSIAHEMKVEDLKRGRTTSAQIAKIEVGTGLSDRLFTVTHLERP